MLRLLIKDITVEKSAPKQLLIHIRWEGNACIDLILTLPPNIADRLRYPAAIVDRVRDMAHHLQDAEIAAQFREEGQCSITGKPYTASIIQWIRFRYRIPPPSLKKPDERTAAIRLYAEDGDTDQQTSGSSVHGEADDQGR
jgi:hypothetical protein